MKYLSHQMLTTDSAANPKWQTIIDFSRKKYNRHMLPGNPLYGLYFRASPLTKYN